jgi:DNA-binding CsgD family transcriptional regulator
VGAVEHLKTLCCLGLPPESAMIAVTPLLHEIIPHGTMRVGLVAPDATITAAYDEHPAAAALYRERFWRFMDDPSALASLWVPACRAVGIGWSLHRQGGGYLETPFYREFVAPLDACWILDAMIGDGGRTIGFVHLSRPRSARPFNVDDVQRLDPLRPWLAHALRPQTPDDLGPGGQTAMAAAGAPAQSGEMILTADARLVVQTPTLEFLLTILAGESANYLLPLPRRDKLPAPILKLLRRIAGAANGTSNAPPRMQVSTSYGVLTLEAKWLVPAGTVPEDAAKDPKACLISVTIELREHPIAHAARVLRESGATPTQVKVGIQLALGKTKPVIADELGIQISSVVDLTKRLYLNLDVHNPAELSTKIWLGQKEDEPCEHSRSLGKDRTAHEARRPA